MFIGRRYELKLIEEHLKDRSKAQLIVIYGRRRIGKSTLIRQSVKHEKKVLFFEGIQGAETPAQIDQFLTDLAKQTGRVKLAAKTWLEVFQGLEEIILQGRWVLIFDEFPWMAAGRSERVSELKLYWDRWTRNTSLALFICGSVASFMVEHLIHAKALHNRKTLEICLGPLSPSESGQFIRQRSAWEKAQLYMCLGGIPKYLEQINPAYSIEKNLNKLCFSANGFFVNELETLFKEQFRAVKTYETIVQALAHTPLNLAELAEKIHISKGGGLHQYLKNLVQAHFVREYSPFSPSGGRRQRTKLYKLVDPFLIFYFRYLHPNHLLIERNQHENLFRAIVQPSIHQYYGFAFERLCEDAFDRIQKRMRLDLADIVTMGPFFQQHRAGKQGIQIDNLIVRRDGVWNIVEYKYHTQPIGMGIIESITHKITQLAPPAHISIEKVLVTSSGVTKPLEASRFFDAIITLEHLVE